MKRWLLSMCVFAAAAAGALTAQRYDLRTDREPILSTANTQWRFHPGDDPSWAAPGFDDSGWPLLKADAPWSVQGYKGLGGYAWYRFKIDTSGSAGHLALRLPSIATNYEVFADGQPMGGCGQLRPEPVAFRCHPQVFDLPNVNTGKEITVALRVWHWSGWAEYFGGGPARAGSLGASALISKEHSDGNKIHRLSVVPYWILCLLYLIGAAAAFFLYLWRRSETEYLWFALMVLFESLEFGWSFFQWSHSLPVHSTDFITDILNVVGWLAAVAFFAELLHAKRTTFFRLTVAALLGVLLLDLAILASPWIQVHVPATNIVEGVLLLFPSTWIVLLLIRRARERFLDAVFLLIPVIILYGSGLLSNVITIAQQFGANLPRLEDFRLVKAPFPIDIGELASFLFLIGMLAILINRFTRTRRVEERYASEFESARHVQEVLVPVQVGSIPGFTVEAEYRPARSVGGDFYQVLPGDDGGVLIVVGDVAGKGMPAAMLVAMIIGTIRTQAAFSMEPATMLQSLNKRLCGHSSGGFSTCLVAYISKDGEMTVSNAGHLSPYLNGKEMSLEAELPLGLQTDVPYPSAKFALQQGDRLTFVSDGIVEATNARKELFGFERTEAISTHPATEIIRAAQAFGQNDDITVVTAAYGI